MKKKFELTALLACCALLSFAQVPKIEPGGSLIAEWRDLVRGKIRADVLVQPRSGTAPVGAYKSGYVTLPVNFEGTEMERACWDLPVDVDMRRSKGLSFDFFCADLSPFVSFTLYLHVDGRWISTAFSPDVEGDWSHIVVRKDAFKGDMGGGRVASIDHIKRIRISGWRARSANTTCALANVALLPFIPEVLIVRGVSSAKESADELQFVGYANSLERTLTRIGLESIKVNDRDITAESFHNIKIAALPYSTSVPANLLTLLQGFVAKGGKVMAFYTLRDGVDQLLGVKFKGWYQDPSGKFSGFARIAEGLIGQPEFARQHSWNANVFEPIDGATSRVIALWRSGADQNTEYPAITLTPNGAVFGHVWLNDSDPRSDRLMLSVIGELNPVIWAQRASRVFEAIGCVDGNKSYADFRTAFKQGELSPQTAGLLRQLDDTYTRAKSTLDKGEWNECSALSSEAQELAVKAWCSRYISVSGEHRAFWCHSAFGLKDYGWDRSIKFLKEHGFNTILPNMSWGASAYYPSKVLLEHESVKERGDQMAQCLAACRKYGVQCHPWKVCWNTGRRLSKEGEEKLRSEGRIQVSDGGDSDQVWLCPSHPANQRMEIEAQLEVVRNYDVDGVHFDYIRYPGSHYCFCEGCRQRFEDFVGAKIELWPADAKRGGKYYDAWNEFRCANISMVVREVAERIPEIRKGVEISAAVFRNAASDRVAVGQDWEMWCAKGWLDFVCPMNYIDSCVAFKNVVALQKESVGDVRLYPGIGLSCWSDGSNYATKLCRQIQILRDAGLKGYTVFNFDARAEQVLPYMRLGTTATD